MSALLLVSLALAGPLFVSVGDETLLLDRSANWPRVFPSDTGWHLLTAAGGDYWHTELSDALVPSLNTYRALTGRSDLVDHGVAACPDGTFLHVGSSTVTNPDDTAYAWRYDAEFDVLAGSTVAESSEGVVHRDMSVVCGETFQGAGFFGQSLLVPFLWVPLGPDAAPGEGAELDDGPIGTGSVMVQHGDELLVFGFKGDGRNDLWVRGYDARHHPITSVDIDFLGDDTLAAYWAQGVARVGDLWVVALMVRDEAAGWQSQDGDVYLVALDDEFALVDVRKVTANTPPLGSMQPWVAIKDGRLVVTYVRDLQVYGVEVEVDRKVAGLPGEAEDTGDTGSAGDTGGTGDTAVDTADTGAPTETDTREPYRPEPGETPACGCGGASSAALLPFGWAVGRTRRRRAPGCGA